MSRYIYADNAATTRISEPVFEAMLPFLKDGYGNPSSIYKKGREAKAAVEQARVQVANALGAEPQEIFFTGCGTESDNWALKATARMLAPKGKKHIITTVFEHHAILHSCETLAEQGFDITYLPVGEKGLVDPQAIKDAIRPDTALVSVMYANNEIGTIQPIAEIGAICKEKGVLLHTDAVQAVGHVKIDVKAQNIDMLSLSGHKIHAPKGIGVFYRRKGLPLKNFIDGGGQEGGKRAGTENVVGIVALGKAIEIATADIDAKVAKMTAMRNRLIDGVLKIPQSRLNGDRDKRLPGNANFSFIGVEGESLLLMLDLKGVAASSGSACTSGSLDPSHVLLSLGLTHEWAHGSLRISMDDLENSEADVDYILEVLPGIIEKLREMSPLWEKIVAEQAQ